jgi:ABC-type transport system involved in multi-copper enzyme maturation permease subunit
MKEVFLFELKYRLRRPATYIYIFIVFLIPLLLAVFEKSVTAQFVNSPSSITQILGGMSVIGIFMYAAIMGVPVYRDDDHKTAQTYFTFPIKPKHYILGRFWGSFTIVTILNISIVLGTLIGFLIGQLLDRPDYGTYTAIDLTAYLLPFLFLLQANAFLIGALFFSLMAFFKKMPILYLGGIILVLMNSLSGQFLGNLDNEWLSIYLDPFGSEAYNLITKYWSISELNANQMPVSGKFLLNRGIWFVVAIAIYLFTLLRFDYKKFLVSKAKKEGAKDTYIPVFIGNIVQEFNAKARRGNLWSLTKIEFLSVVKDTVFLVLAIIGVIVAGIVLFQGNQIYGTPSFPLTRFMVSLVFGGTSLFATIILVIYAGEAVHRTRKSKTFTFYDALPISTGALYFSKVTSLLGVAVVLTLLNIFIGVLFQLVNGYFANEIGTYLIYNFTSVFPAYVLTVLVAYFIHVLVNNKFLGHFVSIMWIIGLPIIVLLVFKTSNPMLLFGGVTPSFLSDLNGFGHYLSGGLWLNAYWILMTLVLMMFAKVFWNRGFVTSARERLKIAGRRFNLKTIMVTLFLFVCFAAVGGYSYYNLKVLNSIEDGDYGNELAAQAEKDYSKYIGKPHLQVTELNAFIDVFPKERAVNARGEFKVINNYDTAIDSVLMEIKFPIAKTTIEKVIYEGVELKPVHSDDEYRLFIYKLPTSLQPKQTANLIVETKAVTNGFSNGMETAVLQNGSFFNNSIFPSFHYDRSLTDNGVRKKYDLEKLDYLNPPRTDSTALRKSLFNEDANYIKFEAVVSTSEDQIAIAPGVLVKKWVKDKRSYYHYKLEDETDYFFNVVSASYDIYKDKWTAPSGKKVDIEVYHSPKHKENLAHFVRGVKVSLEYNSKNFYEYPNSIIRIVEFPAHSSFAQSFATTVPYSENIGFVADFSKAEDFNFVFYISAHELGHQWWGHIVNPSKTSGANIISETLAEYTALMAMKHTYGENGIKAFLKNSLDTYLSSRKFSFKPERSLMNVETGPHIWYQKGSMIMYHLSDVIGEDKINEALKGFLEEYKYYEKGVYATSENLYDAIRAVAPDSLKYLVDDGFKEIVLYENLVKEASSKKLEDGSYETTFTIDTKKIYYDDKGKEKKVDDKANLIEIGLFGEDVENEDKVKIKNPFYLESKWLKKGENSFTIITKELPLKAGIDPYNKLIDRTSEDNLKSVILE